MSPATMTAQASPAPAVAAATPPSALLGVYRPAAPVFVAGRGSHLIDDAGREYLDFGSGIGVNALGYGAAAVQRAVAQALATGLIHTSNLYRTEPAAGLAAELCRLSFADRVFFCNSGGEANEGALKFARRYAKAVGGDAKHEVVALRGAFHGRLFGSLAATDRPDFQAPFQPLMPGVRFVEPEPAAIAAAVSAERTAAIIAEPIQGEGGVRPLGADVLRALRDAAEAADAVLIFDEVQCGLGRTGSLFAYEQTGIVPDVLTLAKPLAGGLPMGAVLLTERVASKIRPGDHATTFGGGPLVSAVAQAVLAEVSQPAFLEAVRAKGALLGLLLQSLAGTGRVREVRGRGLMWGVELHGEAAPVVARALDAGLLVLSAGGSVLRLLPPLTISEAELEQGGAVLREVLA